LEPQIVDIRHFGARDFKPLLQAESQVWGKDLRWDYTASAKLIATCLEEKRLSGYALVKERAIEGYSFFFYEGEKGLIGDLFVAPGNGGLEQAVLLVEHVIETLLGTPGLHRVEAQLPHFGFEDLDFCFRSHGFEGYLRRFMAISLSEADALPQGLDPGAPGHTAQAPSTGKRVSANSNNRTGTPSLPIPEGFAFEPWERKYDRLGAELLYKAYRDHIDSFINDQYSSVEGAARLIDNIVRHRGCGEYLSQHSLVAVHKLTRQLAGILALTAVRPGTAHIPQVAVAKQFQGSGLGAAMMDLAFRSLAENGYQEVSLTVTDLNSRAVRLYERMGFQTFRTFGAFVWRG
jgi:ribosomal protein S18 acetylase RimI-like enzyme